MTYQVTDLSQAKHIHPSLSRSPSPCWIAKGYEAPWLEKHLKDDDIQRLLDEYQASQLADQYDIHF